MGTPRTWTMKDGKKIKIHAMQISHIKNCIAMLQRIHARELAELMSLSSWVNGEQASLALDQAIDEASSPGCDCDTCQMIDVFKGELERREELSKVFGKKLDKAFRK